jgi:hypothetical protein
MIYAFSKIRIIISGYVDMCRMGTKKSTGDLAAHFLLGKCSLDPPSQSQTLLFMSIGNRGFCIG